MLGKRSQLWLFAPQIWYNEELLVCEAKWWSNVSGFGGHAHYRLLRWSQTIHTWTCLTCHVDWTCPSISDGKLTPSLFSTFCSSCYTATGHCRLSIIIDNEYIISSKWRGKYRDGLKQQKGRNNGLLKSKNTPSYMIATVPIFLSYRLMDKQCQTKDGIM